MNIKQMFCKHIWERGLVHLTGISIQYASNSPVGEWRIYTISYLCKKCGKSEIKEKYIERGLTDEEVNMLTRESKRYGETLELE